MSRLESFCHHAADPWFNMAFDEAMLGQVTRQPDLILLRLYTWEPAAITIGVNQQVTRALRFDRLGDTPLLRRITGGRAVYHDLSELTYAVALNLDHPDLADWPTSVREVYLRLAEGLRQFLERLGLEAQIVRRSAGSRPERADCISAPCFESAARYELMANAGKVLASAQRQAGRAILQHGSIKFSGAVDHAALPGTLPPRDAVNQPIGPERLAQFSTHFVKALGDWFGVAAGGPASDSRSIDGLAEREALIRLHPLAKRNPLER